MAGEVNRVFQIGQIQSMRQQRGKDNSRIWAELRSQMTLFQEALLETHSSLNLALIGPVTAFLPLAWALPREA